MEHSLEVQLPFLQRVLGNFSLVPLAVGNATSGQVAEVLERLWGGRETLIVGDGKYRLASVLAFYRTPLEHDARPADFTTSQWIVNGDKGLGYPYWTTLGRWSLDEIIFVDDKDDNLKDARKRYRDVKVVYDSGTRYAARYEIAICRGLRRAKAAPEASRPAKG